MESIREVEGHYGRTDAKDISEVARDMSLPGHEVSARVYELGHIVLTSSNGRIEIEDPDTHPVIFASQARSAGSPQGGGSQLYQIALTWAHNNGKTIHPSHGLSEINKLRRTSNMLSSALRHGTTSHVTPDPDQYVAWQRILSISHSLSKRSACGKLPPIKRSTMKAIIRFKDGTEATYQTNEDRWYSDDQHLANQLNLKNMDLPYEFDFHRHVANAKKIAAAFDAEVIYADPVRVETFEPSKKAEAAITGK